MTTPDTDEQISFAELGISEPVLRALADVGYESASPIQAATIPPLLEGRHVVGLAQTGTGKTAAFALPILSRIDLSQRTPQALILAPTRELALQVCEAISKYAHYLPGLNAMAIYGGQSYGIQLAGLRRGAHIVVGTPGRVIDHLSRKTLDLSELRFLVLDEADEMLQMGFQEDVETILADTPEDKQVALFSATMPSQIRRISKKYLTDAAEITVKSKTMTAANTRQRYMQVANPQKMDALTRVLEVEPFEAMIIFVRTKSATEDLAERLRARGFSAAAINGDLVQTQRERTIGQLKNGDLDILVATDVAARGLDVDRISHVLNYDIPHDSESYVHRIGRTGRAGRSGEALMFVTPREKHLLASIERATRQPLTEMPLPTVDDVNSSRVAKFAESITENLLSNELAVFRGLVEDYQREHNVPVVDIAAALALLSQDESFLLKPDPPRRESKFTIDRPRKEFVRGESRDSRGDSRDSRGDSRDFRADGPRSERPRRDDSDDRGRSSRRAAGEMATYRIHVGRRHKVMPGAIVGAIANEGGLGRADFGAIDIRVDHTLVELPAQLSTQTLEALQGTRISGVLINLEPAGPDEVASSPHSSRHRDDGSDRPERFDRGDRPERPDRAPRSGGKPYAGKSGGTGGGSGGKPYKGSSGGSGKPYAGKDGKPKAKKHP